MNVPGTFVVAHPCPHARAALIAELEARGHSALACGDGIELVELLNHHLASGCAKLDVLIGDASLPGYRPVEVIACLRWLTSSFPAVLTGADEEGPPSDSARRAGVHAVLGSDASVTAIADAAERAYAAKRAWEIAWAESSDGRADLEA